MFTLTVHKPDGSERVYELGTDQGLVLGRDATADVVLESKRVSRRHARFYTEGEKLFLEDLESQNGTFVGGARIQGLNEVRPGPPVEVGEFRIVIKRVDPRARASLPAASDIEPLRAPPMRLRGTAAMAGRDIALAERCTVGRDPAAQVSVDNDSVSRRHAELRSEAGVWVVRDLGSSNGTFVNGRRLAPELDQRLSAADKLRFGETYWVLEPDRTPAPVPGLDRRKKLVAGALVAVVVVLAVLALRPRPPPPAPSAPDTASAAEDALARGQAALEADRFDEAHRAFQEALDADPFNSDARLALRRAAREIECEKALNDSRNKAGVGRNAEALALLLQIDTDSRFFARARLQAQDLAHALMRQDLARCRDAGRHGTTKVALEACSRYLDYACHETPDEDALKTLRAAEAREHPHEIWNCPPRLDAWFGTGRSAGPDAAREIAARYPGKDLGDAVLAYYKGEMESARRSLARAARGSDPKAAEVGDAIALVEGRFKEGQVAANRSDLAAMDEAFEAARDADERILPASLRASYYHQSIASLAARTFYNAGNAKFTKGFLVEAWDEWDKGIHYAPGDSNLQDGRARLEKKAEELLAGSPDCDTLQKAEHITVAQPESPSHARARDLIEKKCQ